MKKLLACILLLAPLTGWADTVTSRLSLTQPDINSANWGTKLNNNFGLIDVGVGVLGKTNSWTGTNNFTGPISISSYTTITSSVAFSTISVVNLTATNATISSATIANASITGFLVNVSTIVASSATLTGVTGSTLTYSSATFTNASVTGTLTAGTANVSGNESLTGTLTVASSTTLKGNVGINGNVDQPLTLTSSATIKNNVAINGVLAATGSVTLGSAGSQVTISSNAIIGPTTFYANGPALTNGCGYVKGSIIQVQTFSTITSSATTAGAGYAQAGLTGSFTPLCSTSKLRIIGTGELTNSSISALDCQMTIFRNPGASQVDLTPSAGKGLCYVGDGGVAAAVGFPCSMIAYDSPATTSATTYTAMQKFGAGSGTCTFTTHGVSTLNVEEIAQ